MTDKNKMQEKKPEISKQLVSEPILVFFLILKFFLTSSLIVFVDTNVSFSTPYETKDSREVIKPVPLTL
jgi:hypothetical protein